MLPLNQDSIVGALSDHLDSVQALLHWVLFLAIPLAWAGIRGTNTIKTSVLEVQRTYAFYLASICFFLVNVAILVLFLRTADLVAMLDKEHFHEGITTLATHSWALNPFSFYGTGTIARIHSCAGFGLLIACWWVCNTAISTLNDKQGPTFLFASGLLLLTGLASMGAINLVFHAILEGAREFDKPLLKTLMSTFGERSVATFAGIGIGFVIYSLALALKGQMAGAATKDSPPTTSIPLSTAATSEASEILMKGLPIYASGWNGIYKQTVNEKNGRPVWARPEHWYLGFLPLRIIGVTIWFDGTNWVLHRDCDPESGLMFRSNHGGDSPVGDWEGGATVTIANEDKTEADDTSESEPAASE